MRRIPAATGVLDSKPAEPWVRPVMKRPMFDRGVGSPTRRLTTLAQRRLRLPSASVLGRRRQEAAGPSVTEPRQSLGALACGRVHAKGGKVVQRNPGSRDDLVGRIESAGQCLEGELEVVVPMRRLVVARRDGMDVDPEQPVGKGGEVRAARLFDDLTPGRSERSGIVRIHMASRLEPTLQAAVLDEEHRGTIRRPHEPTGREMSRRERVASVRSRGRGYQ